MAKMNRLRTWVFQDLTHFISRKPLQNDSTACFHNTAPPWRFWSFLEFSKKDGQYLNRTKENEASQDNVNLPETLLAFPRAQKFQLAFDKNEKAKDSSVLNAKLKNLKKEQLPVQDEATEEVSLKENRVESTKSENVPEPASVAPTHSSSIPEDPNRISCNTKSFIPVSQLKNNSKSSAPNFKAAYKVSSSKSFPRISQINGGNKFQSTSIKLEKAFPILSKENGQSNTTFMMPLETFHLKRSKSFSDQNISRHFSGVAESTRDLGLNLSKTSLSKSSIQKADMSSKSGKRNRNRRKSNDNNGNDDMPECKPPCPPPPPPPSGAESCCPPPPPPCCPEPPPKPNNDKKSNNKNSDCPSPPPTCDDSPEMPKNKKKCKTWCPDAQKYDCYQAKCPKKKQKPPTTNRICPPKCFEPDPCEKPKAFCVGCPPKKKNNDKKFSTWARVGIATASSLRSFASDTSGNKSQIGEKRLFNRKIPKPNPICKGTKDSNACKPTVAVKPANHNCNRKAFHGKNICQNSEIFSFAKTESKSSGDVLRRELEEMQRGKKESQESGRSESDHEKRKGQRYLNKTLADKEIKIPPGLEKIISPSKLEKMRKYAYKIEDSKSATTVVEEPIGAPIKTILAPFHRQQTTFKSSEKFNSLGSLKTNITEDSKFIKESGADEDLAGNFDPRKVPKEMEPRNWLTYWFS